MNRIAIAASMIAVRVSKAPADLPTQLQTKAPLMAPGFRWSGFYIGGSGQGMLTSDAGAQDWLTGLPFHRGITEAGGIFGGAERTGAIGILAGGRRSDGLAA